MTPKNTVDLPFSVGDKVYINGDRNGHVATVIMFQVSSNGVTVCVEWFDAGGDLKSRWFYVWQLEAV